MLAPSWTYFYAAFLNADLGLDEVGLDEVGLPFALLVLGMAKLLLSYFLPYKLFVSFFIFLYEGVTDIFILYKYYLKIQWYLKRIKTCMFLF